MVADLDQLAIEAERFAIAECKFCGHDDYNRIRNKKFAELVVEKVCEALAKEGKPLSLTQISILSEQFRMKKIGIHQKS